MNDALLQTKLHIPPLRPNLVSRPRLTERLDQGLQQGTKLTLISAPAGFGKSTLIISWIQQAGLPVAWLSLDTGDNDPTRFWSYVFESFKRVQPELAEDALAALGSPQPPSIEALLTGLINRATTLANEVILVLEDYYLIDNPSIHEAVTFLLEHLPPQLRLWISGRSDPPLPLARLRGQGQLSEIRELDLRFTTAEAITFFQQMVGLQLSSEHVAILNARTEGWIVGLQLAGLALQGREDTSEFIKAFAGDHSYVINYLTDEVFDRQSEGVQAFLLQTSILNHLHGPLCDAIISGAARDQGSSQDTLEYLTNHNLFLIPLDDRRQWYRYHHLFADLLHYRLKRSFPAQAPDLHRLASEWYASNNLIPEAIHHALAAEDFNAAADLIDSNTNSMIGRGETKSVQRWIESLPELVVRQRPRLCIALAWTYNLNQEDEEIEPLLQIVDRALEKGTIDQSMVDELRGHATVLRAYTALGHDNPLLALQLMNEALAILPEEEMYMRSIVTFTQGVIYKRGGAWPLAAETLPMAQSYGEASGNLSIAIGARCHLIEMLIIQGQLQRAAELCRETIKQHLAEHGGNPLPNLGFVYTHLGEILLEWNDLKAAWENLERGLELSSRMMVAWSWGRNALICQARIKQIEGEPAAALALLEKAINTNDHMSDLYDIMNMAPWQARLWLMQNKLTLATGWAEAYLNNPGDSDEFGDVVLARVRLAQGLADDALDILTPISRKTGRDGRMNREIETVSLQAVAYQARKKMDQAQEILKRALSLAEADGYVRTFVDEGWPMKVLLKQLLIRPGDEDFSRPYVMKLLNAFTEEEEWKGDPLKERELQVLRLLAAGYKTPEIAEELHLANSTVKWYLRNIYSKLGVHKRADALSRARELDFL